MTSKQSQDQSANDRNPNNPGHQASVENRRDQLNPDHVAYDQSRQGNQTPAASEKSDKKGGS
ncbi:hypothetical protein H8N03_17080 [Ramlibacter sp. USB13]|uniref:Uncharacterized protein n=1 Tax=Ramlibacter cellulosilyticus TaxID=2764187 RepID=A0A923MT28_9BURK|nr:hypothetical protein [Ramlibacter cellulosilyticus]MBC5784665.1 hypothetical protein [Ramlibacter cellulosilyticus]